MNTAPPNAPGPRPRSRFWVLAVLAAALLVGGVVVWAALSGSSGSPAQVAFLREADSVAPSAYDTDFALVTSGRVACEDDQAGKTEEEIADSLVRYASVADATAGSGKVQLADAARFVTVALRHCPYLTSPEAARMLGAAEVEYLQDNRERLIQQGVDKGLGSREESAETVDGMIADALRRAGEG